MHDEAELPMKRHIRISHMKLPKSPTINITSFSVIAVLPLCIRIIIDSLILVIRI
jgi:hypothetical protein